MRSQSLVKCKGASQEMDSKQFRVKRILIVFALIGLVMSSVANVKANPTYSISDLYSVYNSSSWTEKDVPSGNYTAPYSIIVNADITWNGTTSNAQFTATFRNISNEVDGELFGVKFLDSGVMQLLAGTTASVNVVGSSTYTIGTDVKVSVAVDGIKCYNGSETFGEYYMTTFNVDGHHGSGGTDFMTAGKVNYTYNDGGDYGLDIISSMVPVLVTIAVLGAVMKAFTKFKVN